MDPREEENLLQYYGGDRCDEGFVNEVNDAREWIAQHSGWSFWAEIATMENNANRYLARINPSMECEPPHSRIQEKGIRAILMLAHIEASTGIDLQCHFYPEFARYIYPKLLRRIKANIEQATPNHPPARSSSCM